MSIKHRDSENFFTFKMVNFWGMTQVFHLLEHHAEKYHEPIHGGISIANFSTGCFQSFIPIQGKAFTELIA